MRRWKTRFRRFMGWNLPRRRLDLNFGLLPPNRRGRKPRVGGLALARMQQEHKNDRAAFLEALLNEIKALNRYAMSPRRRLLNCVLVLKVYYPLAIEAMGQYSKAAGIPDDTERQRILDLVAEIARALATSYKLVFQSYYDASRFWYARHRTKVYLCAFRVLELVRLEQRLLGLRYRRLEGRGWQDANTLFVVLASYESVDFPLPRIDAALRDGGNGRVGSPHDLYAGIQAFALLDHTTWPTEQHGFIDTYRESVEQAVIASLDVAGRGGPDFLYASAYRAGPPGVDPPGDGNGPAVRINCAVLAHSIRSDYRELLQSKTDDTAFNVPRLLAPLQEIYRLSIASLMNRNVNDRMRWLDAGHVGDPVRGLHIYVGFKDIEQHLRGIFSRDPEFIEKRQLADSLADRSALFGQDHTATEESLWHVLHSDNRLLGLQTQETCYTTPMGIGSLLAYGVGDVDRRRPRLGAVSRIDRPQTGTVKLEILRLASFAEPVTVAKDMRGRDAGEADREHPPEDGFIVHDRRFGWGLLLPNRERLWQRTPVIMRRGGHMLDFKLGKVMALTHYFILFRLPSEFQGLGKPDYPRIRVDQGESLRSILDGEVS